jgi:iron complex transport system ATP-binding protein
VLLAIHDLNLALAWCSRLIVLYDGVVDADGPPEVVLDAARIARVWGGGARLADVDGRPAVLPNGREGARDD